MDLSASAGPSLNHHPLFTIPTPNIHRPNYAASLCSSATRPSALNFNHHASPYPLPSTILTRADLRDSVDTFAAMLAAAKAYRSALMALSSATSAFAKALEECARLKGAQSSLPDLHPNFQKSRPHTAAHSLHRSISSHDNDLRPDDDLSPAERLLAASGLHFMTANLEQVLSATFYKSFEIPLLDLYDAHRRQLAERQASYDSEVLQKTETIRDTELRNMYQGPHRRQRRSPRDLDSFRRGLRELQEQVEDLERVKQTYYLELAAEEHEIWKAVADNIGLVVKSEVEVYDRIASKPTSDPTLESMVAAVPDPFDAYKDPCSTTASPGQPAEIYTILPPLSSILSGPPAPARRGNPGSCSPGSPASLADHGHLDSSAHWGDQPALAHPPEFPDTYTSPAPTPSALFHSPPQSPADALPAPDWLASASASLATPLRNVLSLASTDSGATITITATIPRPASGRLAAVDEPPAETAEIPAGPSDRSEHSPEPTLHTQPAPDAPPAPPAPAPPLPPYALTLTPATPTASAEDTSSEAVGKEQMISRVSMADSLAELYPKRRRRRKQKVLQDGQTTGEEEEGNGLCGSGSGSGSGVEGKEDEEEEEEEEESLLGQKPPSGIDLSDSEV